jgi:hypothetical protein
MASEEGISAASVTRSSTRNNNNHTVAKVSAESSSSSTTTTPKQQERAKLNNARLALWAASLEMWCHQILAVRQVYPKETFCSVEFLSATAYLQANRHPGVISYIAEAIQVAVPALLVDGVANELSLVILHHHQDRNNNNDNQLEQPRQLEKYRLSFSEITPLKVPRESSSSSSSAAAAAASIKTNLCLEDLEREMMDLVLSVHTLGQKSAIGSTKANHHNDNTTFKIMLHVPTSMNQDKPRRAMACSKLKKALSDGRWYFPSVARQKQQQQHDNHSPPAQAKERLRPIHDMNLPTGRVHFSMSCFASEQPKKRPRAKRKVSFAEKTPLLEEILD